LEHKLHKWIEELPQEVFQLCTNNVIAQAINLDDIGQLKLGNAVSITRRVYHFLDLWYLSICRVLCVGQKLSGHLQKVKYIINKSFPQGHPKYWRDLLVPDMDKTAPYFDSKSKIIFAEGM
jgi:hypothetical protein